MRRLPSEPPPGSAFEAAAVWHGSVVRSFGELLPRGLTRSRLTINREILSMDGSFLSLDDNGLSLETLSVSSDHVLDNVSDEQLIESRPCTSLDPSLFDEGLAIVVEPPREVRSSSKSEKRIVSVSVRIPDSDSVRVLRCRLMRWSDGEHVKGGLRGDVKKTLQPGRPASGVLDLSLCVCATSRKHGDEDFVVAVALEAEDGAELSRTNTSPFYAFSHQSTLKRRKQIAVSSVVLLANRTLKISGSSFLDSPKLNVLLDGVEAEKVIFKNDRLLEAVVPHDLTFDSVVVTNDGRHFSEPCCEGSASPTVKRARL